CRSCAWWEVARDAGRLGRADGLPIVAAAEVLIRAVVDRLVDEPHGAIDQGEICAAGMVRLVTPGDGPIHDAAGHVAGGIGGWVALAGDERRRRIGHAVDLP